MKAIARAGRFEIVFENASPSVVAREMKEFTDEVNRLKRDSRKSRSKKGHKAK